MSSQSDLVTKLQLAQLYLYQFGGPILVVIGTLSCLLSLSVFMKKTLRKNPCSIYLIAFNIANLIYIFLSFLPTILSTGYNININTYHVVLCRFFIYNALLVDILSPCYLILASIDRILITSRNARTRRYSTQRLAYICILGVTLFWLIFHSYALISTNILQFGPNYFICYFDSNIILALVSYYGVIVKGFLIPLLMALCGCQTVRHIQSVRRVAIAPDSSTHGPTGTGNQPSVHSKDRQLVLIILLDISIYLVFSLMIIGVIMYEQVTQYNAKTYDQIQIEYSFRMIGAFGIAVPFCTDCFSNLLVSKTFRKESKNVLVCQ